MPLAKDLPESLSPIATIGSPEFGWDRLERFLPLAGQAYKKNRNYDYGAGKHAHVSLLSPFLRHRILSEQEVFHRTLKTHSWVQAESFLQEVCWRTYWKGWLEQRPAVYEDYRLWLRSPNLSEQLQHSHEVAVEGRTNLPVFDDWVRELRETGYLHNHSRLWFASIWIYTFRIPWQLGADFFLRHLLDGDTASNTLGWRWVAGLQTKGKQYLATKENIERFTQRSHELAALSDYCIYIEDRLTPEQLQITPLESLPEQPKSTDIHLVWPDDLNSPALHEEELPKALGMIDPNWEASGLAPIVKDFRESAVASFENKWQGRVPVKRLTSMDDLSAWLHDYPDHRVSYYRPFVGDGADLKQSMTHAFASRTVQELRRPWDTYFFKHAKAGFFRFKKAIPQYIQEHGLDELC